MKCNRVLTLTSALTLTLLYVGCDAFPETEPEDPVPPAQTEIVRIEVVPNPVAAEDTALFRVVIKDSLDKRFKYRWTKALGNFVGVDEQVRGLTTDTNSVRWVAPSELGTFGFTVRPDNGSRDSLATGSSFNVTVVDRG